MTKQLLIVGKPNSGKTTFLAQLHLRLDINKSALKLYKPVNNLTPIIDALKCLANGEEVKPTSPEKRTSITFPMLYNEQKIDLTCPDYGGEQINYIVNNREVNSLWSDSIKQSDNWILFIRPTNLSTGFDLSNKTLNSEIIENGKGETVEYTMSDQSSFIELLQIMLYIKGIDSHFKNSKTKLTIVLTCWDEIKDNETPKEKLIKSLPLLFNYIKSNWEANNFNVIGLSSLGFSLKEIVNKEKYQSEGSENFGYIINQEGEEIKDLTQLIVQSL